MKKISRFRTWFAVACPIACATAAMMTAIRPAERAGEPSGTIRVLSVKIPTAGRALTPVAIDAKQGIEVVEAAGVTAISSFAIRTRALSGRSAVRQPASRTRRLPCVQVSRTFKWKPCRP